MGDAAKQTILQFLQAMGRLKASDLFVSEDRVPSARVHGTVRALKAGETKRSDFDELFDTVLTENQMAAFADSGGD